MEKDLNNLTKEELISKIKQLQKEKKLKHKYGLVWDSEKEPEQVVELCKNNIPILKHIKSKDIKTDNTQDNILIEGDNYHALQVLNYTHKNKIDVIYIDPPYNRGGDFVYNDKLIETDDEYKHSKWISSIYKRILLAKNLLSNDGILIISIDDFEYANLKLICDEIFGENFVDTMIWRKSGEGRDGKMKNTTTFRKDHEYIIFCFKNKALNKLIAKPEFKNEYKNLDNDPRGPYKAGSISRKENASNPNSPKYYTVFSPKGKAFTRQFDIEKEEFDKLNNDILTNKEGFNVSRIYWGKDNLSVPAIKIFINEEREITPSSILLHSGTTTEGTKEVSEILNRDCSKMRPKPTSLISTLIQLSSKQNSIILDFYAGTGTTAHSVLLVNKKFKGTRTYIMCTNNKENICTDFCYPRIQKIINGYNKKDESEFVEGLGGNLKYFKTDFISVDRMDKITDSKRKELTKKAGEIIGIKEDTLQEIEINNYYQILSNNTKTKFTAIYFRENEIKLEELINKIKNKKTVLYVFSYGKVDRKMYRELSKNISIEDIPQPILDIYKELNLKIED